MKRRKFLKTATVLLGIPLVGSSFPFPKNKLLLSFSTLGCPDWSFQDILKFAVQNNYDGVEFRGIKRELDLTKCPEFNSRENILSSRKQVEASGLKIVDLGCSAAMHHRDGTERQNNLDDAKRFIDLAQQLNCPFIRVFPNNLPKGQERNATTDQIIKGLLELGDYAKDKQVGVILETHGDLVDSTEIKKIMDAARHPNVGLVWDIVNMWSVTKEPPAAVYEKLSEYIRHTHIKDLKFVDGKEHFTLLGKGESPIFDAINILSKAGYKGYYSFEWEKLWHPEIEAPEIALAEYPKVMKQHFF